MKSLIIFKLIPRHLILLARKHIPLKPWRQMTVVPLNHANRRSHLHSKRVDIHISTTQRYIDVNAAQLSAAVELL